MRPMTDESMAKAPGKILHLPVVAGAVAITYNLPGNPKLKLDSDVIAGIYLGKITKWNDPKIAALNPGVSCPTPASWSFTAPTAAAPASSSPTTSAR